jgi:hypothetical protein
MLGGRRGFDNEPGSLIAMFDYKFSQQRRLYERSAVADCFGDTAWFSQPAAW